MTKVIWYDIIIKHFESGPERLTKKGFTISKIGCQPGFEIRESGFQKPEKKISKKCLTNEAESDKIKKSPEDRRDGP